MPRLALLAVLALCACLPHKPDLSPHEVYEIRRHAPDADLDNLTPAQVAALSDALHHGDGFDLPYRIRSILMW